MRDARIRFGPASPFQRDLKARVRAYFAETGRSPYGTRGLWLKFVLLLGFTAGAVALFAAGGGAWWESVLFGGAAGLGVAGLGFNVQHDASHGAFSARSGVNRLLARVLDAIGGSSFIWRFKHNVVHHTYTNLVDVDQDLEAGAFGRLAPGQPRRAFHRFQHLYLWVLYAALTAKWGWFDDFDNVARGRLGSHRLPKLPAREWVGLFAGKLFAIGWTLALPIAAQGLVAGLLFHVALHVVAGITLTVVFQLAHCVEEAEFPEVPTPEGVAWDWARHQLDTSVDFARGNRVLSWFLGGLNFQAIHHLFPHVSHVHYPALSPIVERVCREHGVRYRANPSFARAVLSHYRWLRRLGRPDPAPSPGA